MEREEIELGYEHDRFENTVSKLFHCPICSNVLKQPVMCRSNQHYFCTLCITRHLKNSSTCPTCKDQLTIETVEQVPRIVTDHLSELNNRCDYFNRGCREVVRLNDVKSHVDSCGFSPVNCSNEGCTKVVNKRDQIHHETELCKFRRVNCHDCGEFNKEVEEIKVNLKKVTDQLELLPDQFNRSRDMHEETMKKIKEMRKEIRSMKTEIQRSTVQGLCQSQSTGNILIVGGEDEDVLSKNSVEMFSWSHNEWVQLSSMRKCRSEASSIIYENQIIVAGGFTNDGRSDDMEMMNIKDKPGKWKNFPPKLYNKCYGHKVVNYKDRMIKIGGNDENEDGNYEVLLIPPYSKKRLATLKPARFRHGAEIIDDKVYIFGGGDDEVKHSVVMFDIMEKKFKQMAPLPFGVSEMGTVTWRNNVILLGGKDDDANTSNSVGMYDVYTGETTMLPAMKHNRSACTAVVTDDIIVVMGGYDEENHGLSSVECFRFDHQVWEELPDMTEPRACATAVVIPT